MTAAQTPMETATTPPAAGIPADRRVVPLRAAYADPPYLGLAQAFYGAMHPAAAEYDDPATHRRLIERLSDEYDCWALSLHEPALREILNMCPSDARVAAWVKPFASYKKHVTRAWTWEPVIFRFHRARPIPITAPTWRDHVSAPIAMRRGFPGAKPEAFCYWVFEGLNLHSTDHFCDVFPGSGAVTEAWQKWSMREQPAQCELFAKA
jgi:hypothetical protein